MNPIDILLWGALRHYPQLVLADGSVLRHGMEKWTEMLQGSDGTKIAFVEQRIERWNQLEQKERQGA